MSNRKFLKGTFPGVITDSKTVSGILEFQITIELNEQAKANVVLRLALFEDAPYKERHQSQQALTKLCKIAGMKYMPRSSSEFHGMKLYVQVKTIKSDCCDIFVVTCFDAIDTRTIVSAKPVTGPLSNIVSFNQLRQPLSPTVRWHVLSRDRHACVYCGRKAPEVILEIDHKVSIADGGTNELDNLVTACRECNIGKGSDSFVMEN